MKKAFFGFTLAEVLITLGIIGVVAAMTIPTLVANYQKTQYVTALKKAYTQTNQALKQMSLDYDCIDDLKCTGLFATGTTKLSLGDVFVKYFNIAKNCKTSANQGCWATATNQNYDGSNAFNANFDGGGSYNFITADGMSFYLDNIAADCPDHGTGRTGNMSQTCARLIIDINGLKSPNLMGRDTFEFFITNGKGPLLYPYGGADDNWDGGVTTQDYWWSNSSGGIRYCHPGSKYAWACAGRVVEEGWQMNY